ncbi:MAG: CarD family transcriptional regulator [Bauldia sp.]|nr:CarD family transcriptional regulator [Bauldia sp.]
MSKPKEKKAAAAKAAKPAASKPSPSKKRAVAAAQKAAPARKAGAAKPKSPARGAARPAAAKNPPVTPAKKKPAAAQKQAPTAAKKAAPKPVAAPKAVAAPVAPPKAAAAVVASKPAAVAAKPAETKKPTIKTEFKAGEYIVYPAHGVGRIVGIDTQEVAGIKLDLFVISFLKDKMTLRVPMTKATGVGMRKLADPNTVKRALETVRGRARIKRTMWSRRAQEYEAKINSGDLISIAEVVRDLYRSENQPEQSYSERQLYEAALDRMSREISSVNRISETEAIRQIEQNLAKSPRRGARGSETADAQAA